MTSSLVGSEMCIRDRVCTARVPHWQTAAATQPCAVPLVPSPWMIGVAAVSYTHLTLPTICSV
eukprot:6378527-Prorocentrum_lima.AAC.1